MPDTNDNNQVAVIDVRPDKNKKIKIVVSALIIVLLLGLAGFLVYIKTRPNQPTTPPINDSERLVAEVAGEKIYRKDVLTLAQSQYATTQIEDSVLRTFQNTIIERKLLDIEASKSGITVQESEINAVANPMQQQSTISAQPADLQSLHDIVRYDILKDKITAQVVKSKQAYTLEYWLPPLDDTATKSAVAKQRLASLRVDGKKAFEEALPMIKSGKSFVDTANALYKKYSSLRYILSINGYTFKNNGNNYALNTPKVYTLDGDKEEAYLKSLIGLNAGETSLVFQEDGSGGRITKVISESHGSYDSYDDWLNAKRQEMVKTY